MILLRYWSRLGRHRRCRVCGRAIEGDDFAHAASLHAMASLTVQAAQRGAPLLSAGVFGPPWTRTSKPFGPRPPAAGARPTAPVMPGPMTRPVRCGGWGFDE